MTEKRSGLAHQLARVLWAPSTVLLLVGPLCALVRPADAADPREALLKIYATQLGADYGAPWRAGVSRSVSGSGFVVANHRILTNAHVVSNATFLQVRKYGDSERVPARVLFVSHDADLALLTVEEPGFFDGIPALDLGDLPELRQEVLVLGFPLGGDTLSITRGVVSRIEHQNYVHANASLLAGQIDSAVNPGNSGGPVLSAGKVVGVAMQVSNGDNNIAYMVPTPVVNHFLADVSDGRFDGVPEAAFRWQRLEAADLRLKYGLGSSKQGVLVLDTVPGSAASRTLKAGDVLLSIDGHEIGTDGTIDFRPRERTDFGLLLQEKQLGESVELDLLRGGKPIHAQLLLDRPVGAGRLVPGPLYDEPPRYYIFGGLAFCPLTVNYVQAWGEDWWNRAPRHLLALLQQPVSFEGEEAVVVCSVLHDELNSGYEDAAEDLIVEADGQPVRNLAQLVDTIESKPTGLLVLQTQDGKQIVFDRERARREDPAILGRYQVMSDRSDDLRAAAKQQRVETLAAVGPATARSGPNPR